MTTIVSRFQAIAQAHAGATALISDTEVLTYAALHERSRQMAAAIDQWFLLNKGRTACPTDVIGICIEKCADLYAAILGILSTGASYVPIDPELQSGVREHIVKTCRCELIIASGAVPNGLNEAVIVAPDTVQCTDFKIENHVGNSRSIGSDICYTIFTSGSTGRPKGVKINHTNLLNLADWAICEFSLAPGIRTLQYSTINFDASILDIFPTLLAGATLCIPNHAQRLSEAELSDFCERHGISHAFLPPSLLSVLSPGRFTGLTTLLTGGEACSPNTIQKWLPGRRLYNLYGPTECTVLVSYKRMDRATLHTNIGTAISGVRLYVLNENMELSARGELYVAGLAVSPGYMGDAAATEKKFLRSHALDACTLYKTGDIVERTETGDLIFVGRIDRQVKVRGYRIELEEIEGALMMLGYREVALKVSRQGALVAYLVSDLAIDPIEIRKKLGGMLNDFKIPQHFVRLERFPYKASGKVDYQALPDFVPAAPVSPTHPEIEKTSPIAQLWAKELALDPDTLEPGSNFCELGGTSINIVRLLSSFETRFGIRIDFMDFLNNPTIDFLYRSLTKNEQSISTQS